MASRQISDLSDKLIPLYKEFELRMNKAGIPFIVTCTARSYQEQVALYAQGRQLLPEVNLLRKVAGMAPLKEKDERGKTILYRPVTWTLTSKHIINLQDLNPDNDKANAFDIAILQGKIVIWDFKVDMNKSGSSDYLDAAKIGREVGLRCGADFPNPDYPHFELPTVTPAVKK